MELDDLKQAWNAHGARLEHGPALDEPRLRQRLRRKGRLLLAPHLLWRALEVGLGSTFLLILLPILRAHGGEPRYLLVAGSLGLFAATLSALSAVLLVKGLRLDYGGAVTTLQREVEHLRRLEYRAFKWALLGGVLFWLPVALIAFEALTGVPALARVDLLYLVSNLLFGLAVLALGQALSRRYVERPGLGPWTRRVVDAVSGRGLRVVAEHLDELARFEREDGPRS